MKGKEKSHQRGKDQKMRSLQTRRSTTERERERAFAVSSELFLTWKATIRLQVVLYINLLCVSIARKGQACHLFKFLGFSHLFWCHPHSKFIDPKKNVRRENKVRLSLTVLGIELILASIFYGDS